MAPSNHSSSSQYTFSTAERRTSLRYRSNLKVTCHPIGRSLNSSDPTAPSWSDNRRLQPPDNLFSQGKDVSTNGIGLVCSRQLAPGTVLECQFLNPTTRFICSRPVQVMRVTPQADDKWLAGCRFAQELEFSELLGLL